MQHKDALSMPQMQDGFLPISVKNVERSFLKNGTTPINIILVPPIDTRPLGNYNVVVERPLLRQD